MIALATNPSMEIVWLVLGLGYSIFNWRSILSLIKKKPEPPPLSIAGHLNVAIDHVVTAQVMADEEEKLNLQAALGGAYQLLEDLRERASR